MKRFRLLTLVCVLAACAVPVVSTGVAQACPENGNLPLKGPTGPTGFAVPQITQGAAGKLKVTWTNPNPTNLGPESFLEVIAITVYPTGGSPQVYRIGLGEGKAQPTGEHSYEASEEPGTYHAVVSFGFHNSCQETVEAENAVGTNYLIYSGAPLPEGNITGWKQVFSDNFTKAAALGSWAPAEGHPNEVVYTGDHGGKWASYPWWYTNCSHEHAPEFAAEVFCYEPKQVLSVHEGVLDYYLHEGEYPLREGELTHHKGPMGAAPTPSNGEGQMNQTYGRYEARLKVVYEDANHLGQYHAAWLLWTTKTSGNYGLCAESDFPEVNLSESFAEAFAHHKEGSNVCATAEKEAQDSYCIGTLSWCTPKESFSLAEWHTYRQEWKPGERKYYVDGTLIGTSTNAVWSEPEVWVLQTEGHEHSTGVTKGHLLVDWVTEYELCPTC